MIIRKIGALTKTRSLNVQQVDRIERPNTLQNMSLGLVGQQHEKRQEFSTFVVKERDEAAISMKNKKAVRPKNSTIGNIPRLSEEGSEIFLALEGSETRSYQ